MINGINIRRKSCITDVSDSADGNGIKTKISENDIREGDCDGL